MSAADQNNLREVFEEFWRALEDVEDHLRIVHNTAWPGDWWEGRHILPEIRTVLEEEIGKVLDARKRLHVLALTVAAHVIAPPGQTGEQWVLEVLALGDEAHRLAEEEYGHCTTYRGPMDPDLIVENRNDQELRKYWTDELRQIEEDYQRVSCGLPKAREHLNRVMSVLLPPRSTKPRHPGDRPIWDRERGELTYRGTVIKRVRSVSVAKNVVRVLDAFQEDGWRDRIDDPLDPSKDQQRLHETIKRLNDNLEIIRFRADGTGQGIRWELTAPEPPQEPLNSPF